MTAVKNLTVLQALRIKLMCKLELRLAVREGSIEGMCEMTRSGPGCRPG